MATRARRCTFSLLLIMKRDQIKVLFTVTVGGPVMLMMRLLPTLAPGGAGDAEGVVLGRSEMGMRESGPMGFVGGGSFRGDVVAATGPARETGREAVGRSTGVE